MITPVFRCYVRPDGYVEFRGNWERERYRRWKDTLKGHETELVLRKAKTQRSRDQNAWHWGVAIPIMVAAAGYDLHEHDELHYWLVAKCFGMHERDGIAVPNKRSSLLTVEKFSEFMDWEVRFAAEPS